jgi:hypothetical protein
MLMETTWGNFTAAPAVALIVNGNSLEKAAAPLEAMLSTVTSMVPEVTRSVLRICACRDVALLKEVLRAAPFQSTTESGMKFVPVTVSVKPPPPAVALAGAMAVIVGVMGGVGKIEKFSGGVEPPPELTTVTGTTPALATSVAVICACTVLALTGVVVRALLFHLTVEFAAKFPPLTVMVKAEAPATTLEGESEQIAGAAVEELRKLTAGENISLPPPV